MFDTYLDLANEVGNLLASHGLIAQAPKWIELVESECQKDIRDFRETIIEATDTFVVDQNFILLPEGFRELLLFRIDTDPERRVSIVEPNKLTDVRVNGRNAGQSYPVAAWYGGERKLLLEPAPDAAANYTLYYQGRLATIDQSKSTSQFLRDAPELLLYGAAMHGAIYRRNWQLRDEYRSEFERHKEIYRTFLFRAKTSGGELRVRPDNVPNDSYSREITSPT